jgi:sporulation protein YlmC with PRC-barrel domain
MPKLTPTKRLFIKHRNFTENGEINQDHFKSIMQIMNKRTTKKRHLSPQLLLSQLIGMIVFERRDLRPVGIIKSVIFRAENFQVAFFGCLVSDGVCYIRADQTAPIEGLLTVQGVECFGESNDFIREKQTFAQNCQLLGYRVIDSGGKKFGTVEDCSIKLATMAVERIYVRRPLPHSIMQSSLIISTSAIIDVQPHKKTLVIQSTGKAHQKAMVKPATA